jgi:hypothetical protein
MKVIIVHDALGRIISITKISPDAPKELGVGVLPNPGDSVVEVELTGDDANKSLDAIHRTLAIDVKSGNIIKRPVHL